MKQTRNRVESILSPHGEDLGYAGKMVASELIENALKYGIPVDPENDIGIEFQLDIDENLVTITVKNRVALDQDLEQVKRHIDLIQKSDDPQKLYIERLTELMEKPGQGGSQLGLYRIAYEGRFNLDYEYIDGVLSVMASRDLISPRVG